jgi:hypothetical protein
MGYPGGYEQLAFCAPRIWNQGKARRGNRMTTATFCAPRIWNQGKAWIITEVGQAEFCAPRIWNQGKATEHRPLQLEAFCAPRIWNQGKAAGVAHEVRRAFCAPRIWNQGKAGRCLITLIRIFCAPRIWNQGKTGSQIGDWRSQFRVLVFGIKAKRDLRLEIGDLNFAPPYLESRQNGISDWRLEISISRPRIWNQGKTGSQIGDWRSQFCATVFGVKAKRDFRLEIGDLNFVPP